MKDQKPSIPQPVSIPPICRGVYIQHYVMRFASNNPCNWLTLGLNK